ncbi:MAG: hypothetical protein HYY24_02700 [Verrucomicrobia bacterium]|nr:hypothetical protein [Verrucomicrobiota bacterium]
MPWLKRNLFLLIGVVVAAALMGVAGWFSFLKIGQDQEVTGQLDALTQEFQDLVNPKGKPHPGDKNVDNIKIAREEHERLKALLARTRSHYAPLHYATNADGSVFKLLLEETIYDLQRQATNAGVKLPPNYNFTFNAQRTIMNPASPDALAYQVVEIKAIAEVLFKAKVHELLGMRRSALSTDDAPSSGEFLPNKPSTNDLAILVPYEVTFRGFSAELAAAIQGFYSAPQCFVVKNVTVEKGEIPVAAPEATPFMPSMSPYGPYGPMGPYGRPMGGFNPYGGGMREHGGGMSRYGGMMRPMPGMVPGVAPAAAPQAKPGLDENPLKVTLFVQYVRLKPPGEKKAPSTRPGRPAPAPSDGTTPPADAAAPAEPAAK